jgi:hypothetical protein
MRHSPTPAWPPSRITPWHDAIRLRRALTEVMLQVDRAAVLELPAQAPRSFPWTSRASRQAVLGRTVRACRCSDGIRPLGVMGKDAQQVDFSMLSEASKKRSRSAEQARSRTTRKPSARERHQPAASVRRAAVRVECRGQGCASVRQAARRRSGNPRRFSYKRR